MGRDMDTDLGMAECSNENFYYNMDFVSAPWISNMHSINAKTVDWMIEAQEIDRSTATTGCTVRG